MARRYLRGLQYTTSTNGKDIPTFMKTCYEFWAYCVNGLPILNVTAASNTSPIQITTSTAHNLSSNNIVGIYNVLGNTAANGQFTVTVLDGYNFTLVGSTGNGAYTSGGLITVPGGMPITPTSGPTNFFEGTSVLAVGTDGVTSAIGATLTAGSSTPFNQSMIGKHVVIWSATSSSTDNSIYKITNVIGSTQLILYPFSGGTPDISTQKNNITSRSALNYRVVDLTAAAQLGVASGNYFVGTLSGASGINTGQANSQFQFLLRGSSTPFGQFGMVGSPTGAWAGSSFTGTTLTERTTANSTNFTGTTAGVNGYITLIADTDFFMGHVRSSNTNSVGLYFYAIVPQRLYTQAQDTNPLTMMVGGNNLTNAVGNDSHTSSFAMVGTDGTTRTCQLMTKNFVGDGVTGLTYTVGPNLANPLTIQTNNGQIFYTDALISTISTVGQYCLARARLRPLAFTSSTIGSFQLVGNNGEFIHMGNGTLWPWDGSVLPYSILPVGT